MSKTEDLTLKDRIYETILNDILFLRFMPGEKIPEVQIAKEQGVSRPLVHEAVQRLSWDGLVKLEPNRPPTVIIMDNRMIQDLAFVRWQHDQLAIPLAIYNASARDISELREVAAQCLQANSDNDLKQRHILDAKFHQKIYFLSGNELLYSLHYRLSLLVRLWQSLHITSNAMLVDGLMQHFQLLDAFERRDTASALEIIQKHSSSSFGSDFHGNLLTPNDLLHLN